MIPPGHNVSPAIQRAGPPRLGVAVAAYNAESWLGKTLENLRTQSFRDWRCVIVDDGSTDATAQIGEEFAALDERFAVVRQPNGGLSHARNTGLAWMPEDLDYVTFIDADDLYAPDGLGRLIRALDGRPDAVGVYGLADLMDETDAVLAAGVHPARQRDRRRLATFGLVAVPAGADSTFDDLVANNPVWPALVGVLRLAAVRRIAGFDATVSLREDWDFYLRLTRHGPLAVVDEVVAFYRRHGSNLTKDQLEGPYQRERVLRKAYGFPDNTPRQRLTVRRVWRRQELRSFILMARLLADHCREHRWGLAIRVAVAFAWTFLTVLSPRPPRASRRRIAWAGISSVAWDVTAPLVGSWRTRLRVRLRQ